MLYNHPSDIKIEDFDYELPEERIAKFPLADRSASKLLIYKGGEISERRFKNVCDELPDGSLLVFNNTRVIQARMEFRKESGARIEIFLLEPSEPRDYAESFASDGEVEWSCMIGNASKWKEGALRKEVTTDGKRIELRAYRLSTEGRSQRVRFEWSGGATFAQIIDAAGELPIPPYLNRKTEESDKTTYQTVYSKIKGSVAAPTAGLHFTPEILGELDKRGFGRVEVTLHVGAGTFQPVKSETMNGHEMHTEVVSVSVEAIRRIRENLGKIVAVGTTSVRTLESLYYMGVMIGERKDIEPSELCVGQWTAYDKEYTMTADEALKEIEEYLARRGEAHLVTSTQILIAPSFKFRIIRGMLTNFHQPHSTLLLLVSALVGEEWKRIYGYAMENGFRFLSYGDSSLLVP